MRYCSHCGQPLNPGAAFCHHCGAALKAFAPEVEETPVQEIPVAEEPVQDTPVAEPVREEIVPAEKPASDEKAIAEEKEFLEQTHRLLRWERKAWSITGKVMLIMGIIFAALFFLIGMVAGAVDETGAGFAVFFATFVYAIFLGGMLIAFGIVNLKAADKIPQYTDTLYKDFRAAYERCNSIGLIILGYLFNSIALVYYIINFVRMKSNKEMAERIFKRQGVK